MKRQGQKLPLIFYFHMIKKVRAFCHKLSLGGMNPRSAILNQNLSGKWWNRTTWHTHGRRNSRVGHPVKNQVCTLLGWERCLLLLLLWTSWMLYLEVKMVGFLKFFAKENVRNVAVWHCLEIHKCDHHPRVLVLQHQNITCFTFQLTMYDTNNTLQNVMQRKDSNFHQPAVHAVCWRWKKTVSKNGDCIEKQLNLQQCL